MIQVSGWGSQVETRVTLSQVGGRAILIVQHWKSVFAAAAPCENCVFSAATRNFSDSLESPESF
jgi:hypothetical protein